MRFYAVLVLALLSFANGDENVQEEPKADEPIDPPMGEKISFSSPDMTDEEQLSAHLPKGFECDACTAVAFQMAKALKKAEKNGKQMKESDYLDVFEKVCDRKTYESYGLKAVNGVNRISGEGLDSDAEPGMMYGGGKWPGRLSSKCHDLVGEYGEDEIYDSFRRADNFQTFVCKELTSDCLNDGKRKRKSEL